jgi:hypothetical protein
LWSEKVPKTIPELQSQTIAYILQRKIQEFSGIQKFPLSKIFYKKLKMSLSGNGKPYEGSENNNPGLITGRVNVGPHNC